MKTFLLFMNLFMLTFVSAEVIKNTMTTLSPEILRERDELLKLKDSIHAQEKTIQTTQDEIYKIVEADGTPPQSLYIALGEATAEKMKLEKNKRVKLDNLTKDFSFEEIILLSQKTGDNVDINIAMVNTEIAMETNRLALSKNNVTSKKLFDLYQKHKELMMRQHLAIELRSVAVKAREYALLRDFHIKRDAALEGYKSSIHGGGLMPPTNPYAPENP